MHYQKSESIRMVGFPAQKKTTYYSRKTLSIEIARSVFTFYYQIHEMFSFILISLVSTSSLKKKHTESKKNFFDFFFELYFKNIAPDIDIELIFVPVVFLKII